MVGHKLAVEQRKAADAQPRHQPSQRDFRGVAFARKHAFAAKGIADFQAIKPADQTKPAHQWIGAPTFDAVRQPAFVQRAKGAFDLAIDPGLLPPRFGLGAGGNYLGKGAVAGDGKNIAAQRLAQRLRQMKIAKRQDGAAARFDPESFGIVARIGHGKNADRIGSEQQVEIDGHCAAV